MAERPPWCLGEVTVIVGPDGRKLSRRTSCGMPRCKYFIPLVEGIETPVPIGKDAAQRMADRSVDSLFGWCGQEQAKNAQNN